MPSSVMLKIVRVAEPLTSIMSNTIVGGAPTCSTLVAVVSPTLAEIVSVPVSTSCSVWPVAMTPMDDGVADHCTLSAGRTREPRDADTVVVELRSIYPATATETDVILGGPEGPSWQAASRT